MRRGSRRSHGSYRKRSCLSTALIAGAQVWLLTAGMAAAAEPFALTPGDDPAVARGRQVASRFDLESLWEMALTTERPLDELGGDAFKEFEQKAVESPGVGWVLGPSGLVDLFVDGDGYLRTRSLLRLAHGSDQDEPPSQRVLRRADAGWFLGNDGRTARVLVAADAAAIPAVAKELGADGAKVGAAAPLWPDPRDWTVRWGTLLGGVGGVLFVWVLGGAARREAGKLSAASKLGVVLAAAVGAGAPYALATLPALQWLGLSVALAAAGAAAISVIAETSVSWRLWSRLPARSVPWLGVVTACLIVAAAAVTIERVRLDTQQWREAPLLFVSVRGDVDEPVALRELRRLTDHLRDQPGVAAAWSVADLVQSVRGGTDDVPLLPDSVDEVRAVLAVARLDPALRLQLSADHQDTLVTVRFDPAVAVDRTRFVAKLSRYLQGDWRPSLLRVNLNSELPNDQRALASGLLANDARQRIERICARAGRNLEPSEKAAIDRVARRSALLPAIDLPRLRTELLAAARTALSRDSAGLSAAEQERAARALAAIDGDASAATVTAALRKALETRTGDPAVTARLVARLAALVSATRTRHSARLNERDMLMGAGLPSDGALADQVRGATREAMGPIVGLPVPAGTPGAFHMDAVVVGGAAQDLALSRAWFPGLRAGAMMGAVALALILLLVAGARGLLWLPYALALPAAALIVPALARGSIGVAFVAFLSGVGAAGATLTASLGGRRLLP